MKLPKFYPPAVGSQIGNSDALEPWLWTAVLFVMTAPFEILLTGSDPDAGMTNPSPYYAYLRIFLGVGSLAFGVVKFKRSYNLAKSAWPYLAFFLAFGALIPFAASPTESRFSGLEFFATISVGFVSAARLGPVKLSRSIIIVLIVSVAASLVTALMFRSIGVHSGADVSGGAGRAGEWRGIYIHKNYLGHVAGLTFALSVTIMRKYFGIILSFITAVIALPCVVMAHSSSGIAILVTVPIIYWAFVYPKGWWRIAAIVGAIISCLAAVPFRDYIIDGLLGLLGKSTNLSGRTSIWSLATYLVQDHPWLGGGIGYTMSQEFRSRLLSEYGVNNVHNSYLDSVLNYGLFGAILLYSIIFAAAVMAWTKPVNKGARLSREFFTTVFFGWIISSFTEIIAVRPYSVVSLIGVSTIFGLFSIASNEWRSVPDQERNSNGRRRHRAQAKIDLAS